MGATALVTTTTATLAATLAKRLPVGALHQYAPLDSPPFMRRFITIGVPMPRWWGKRALARDDPELKRSKLRLAMVNGRISERSSAEEGAALYRRPAHRVRCVSRGAKRMAIGSPCSAPGTCSSPATSSPTHRRCRLTAASSPSSRVSPLAARCGIAASTHQGEIRSSRWCRAPRPGVSRRADAARATPSRTGRGNFAAIGGAGPQLRAAVAWRSDQSRDCGLRLRHNRRARAFLSPGRGGVRRQILVAGGGQNPIEPARLASAILHGPGANFADAYPALDDFRRRAHSRAA